MAISSVKLQAVRSLFIVSNKALACVHLSLFTGKKTNKRSSRIPSSLKIIIRGYNFQLNHLPENDAPELITYEEIKTFTSKLSCDIPIIWGRVYRSFLAIKLCTIKCLWINYKDSKSLFIISNAVFISPPTSPSYQ